MDEIHHLRSTTLKKIATPRPSTRLMPLRWSRAPLHDKKVFYEAFGIFDNQSIERKALSARILLSASFFSWTAGWESATCWLWRNPWSRNWTGVPGLLCDPDAGRADGKRITFRRNHHVTDRILLPSQKRPAAGTLSNGDCSGAVYMAIWDWCESELDLDVRFPAPRREDTLDCALCWRREKLASQLLAALREQDLPGSR